MRIANNITAMNTHRMYTGNNNAISKSAEKLSSGYRINRAGDDAAGLAISEKMRAQIRGLSMASKNSQDANSLIQTAEGALQEVHSMLQRMNELANQSATGTNQDFDREQISAEFDQLKKEIDDISEQTNFNNMKLLDGSLSSGSSKVTIGGEVAPGATLGHYTLTAQGSVSNQAGTYTMANGGSDTELKITFTENVTNNTTNTIIDLEKVVSKMETGKSFTLDLTAAGMGVFTVTADSTATVTDTKELRNALVNDGTGGNNTMTATAGATTGNGGLQIQVGANENETLTISVDAMDTEGLGLASATIADQSSAEHAITSTQEAINRVSAQRSTLGAMQNRLEHKINNLDNTAENLSASESRIRDVDLAKEMTSFTKNQILSQAATSMLAQANSMPQNVLSLLQ